MDTINTNIDTNSVDKKKKYFIPKLIAILTSAFSIIGVGTSLLIKSQYKSALAVEYDDEDSTITFDVNELNNYHFDNLATYIDSLSSDDFTDIGNNWVFTFGESILSLDENIQGDSLNYENVDVALLFVLESAIDDFGLFKCLDKHTDYEQINFYTYLSLNTQDTFYDDIKSAIELDIQANQPYTNNTFLQDIVELLVGGIVAFSGGFATGLNSLVSALAIQNGAMSPFMAVVLCFGGLALAFGLSRWLVDLLGSLGQRNR